MIDDLVTLGTKEPYRMFTARAEYRLSLRADNADFRLTQKSHEYGAVGSKRIQHYLDKKSKFDQGLNALNSFSLTNSHWNNGGIFSGSSTVRKTASEILSQPSTTLSQVQTAVKKWSEAKPEEASEQKQVIDELLGIDVKTGDLIDIECKYRSYLERQRAEISKLRTEENLKFPPNIDFQTLAPLSNEEREKLSKFKPETLGAANRISGITPASLTYLYAVCKKYETDSLYQATKAARHIL